MNPSPHARDSSMRRGLVESRDAGRGCSGTVAIDSTHPPRWSEVRLPGAVP